MSLITFDYQCLACGNIEERRTKRSETGDQACTVCDGRMKKLISAPRLDITGMANAGCPGALESVQNGIEKKHRAVDQHHRKAGS